MNHKLRSDTTQYLIVSGWGNLDISHEGPDHSMIVQVPLDYINFFYYYLIIYKVILVDQLSHLTKMMSQL